MKRSEIIDRLKHIIACWQPIKSMPLKEIFMDCITLVENSDDDYSKSTKNKQLFLDRAESKVSDEHCWELIQSLGEEDGAIILAHFCKKGTVRKIKEAIKNNDCTLFLDLITPQFLTVLKMLIMNWEFLKCTASISIEFYEKILTRNHRSLALPKQVKQEINDLFWGLPNTNFNDLLRLPYNKVVLMGEKVNDEEELAEDELISWLDRLLKFDIYMEFFEFNDILPDTTQEAILTVFKESKYAVEIQELYNQYRKENPNAKDMIICSRNYERIDVPKKKLLDKFDETKKICWENNNLHLDLTSEQVKYIYHELIKGLYISENTDIECFGFFLTGKPENYSTSGTIEWLREREALGCLVGLLCRGEGVKGKFIAAGRAFTFKEKKMTTKVLAKEEEESKKANVLSTSFRRIEKRMEDDKNYKNASYDYMKKISTKMKKKN
ncbi:hypothetical protein [Odoribacter laneus]|uniref:hypothetical protein n=1 Tax=Odoribacter laneus TaxID=626933 RepID=UPI003AF96E3E